MLLLSVWLFVIPVFNTGTKDFRWFFYLKQIFLKKMLWWSYWNKLLHMKFVTMHILQNKIRKCQGEQTLVGDEKMLSKFVCTADSFIFKWSGRDLNFTLNIARDLIFTPFLINVWRLLSFLIVNGNCCALKKNNHHDWIFIHKKNDSLALWKIILGLQ